MITEKNGVFVLETGRTSYLFRVMETGQLEQLYYGRRIHFRDASGLTERHSFAPGNGIYYDDAHKNLSLEDACLEMSSYGKGDIREPFLEIVYADGSFTSDFVFDAYGIAPTKAEFATLPASSSALSPCPSSR